ncbi:hypothetical protein RJ639_001202 [Escallonia herrerae]|uniref:Histone deacetylase domain-containing protein n=1 Tax=Escallonia herrerae TaxID=1293975 RepID=A0AA88XAH5_9ASTE|nr:hypothetical protein RJ639_001202 [Escallonia herrerae]
MGMAAMAICVCLEAMFAEDNHVLFVHTQQHVEFIKIMISTKVSRKDNKLANDNNAYFNQGLSQAVFTAGGCVVKCYQKGISTCSQLAMKVAKGEINSEFDVVRLPGHNAEGGEAKGLCLLNDVAVARPSLS